MLKIKNKYKDAANSYHHEKEGSGEYVFGRKLFMPDCLNCRELFINCIGLSGSIPSDLLLHVPLVTDLQEFFRGCKIPTAKF
jgi:hypothetical protein